MTRQKRAFFFISTAIVVTTITAYEPIRHNGFVNYDDDKYITNSPEVTSGGTRQSIGLVFTQAHFHMWHPLTTLSHTLDYEIFGLNSLGHHIVSLVIHIINALLIFWILTNITGSIWSCAFVAALFALHPIQVESVAWAAERKTVLSGLFWLLTMTAYIHYTKKLNVRRYILVLAVYGLCIMTKPVVVTLPLAMLLLDYWPLERLGGQRTEDRRRRTENGGLKAKDTSQKVSTGHLIAEKAPLLVLSAILSVMTFIFQKSGEVVMTLESLPLNYRITNIFISYIRYIGKMIWPSKLAVFYPHTRAGFSDTLTIICILLFVMLSVVSIYIGLRKKYILMGWLWFIVTLIPVIGLVQAGNQAMANRYMYVPMLGLLIIIAWSIKGLISNRPSLKVIAAITAFFILTASLILTRMQVRHWQNDLTLFGYALQVTEENEIAENGYGFALSEAGFYDKAESHFSNAARINPTYFDARNNLGKTFLKREKLDEAIACFKKLIERNPNYPELYYNLAIALSKQKEYDEAIKYFALTLEKDSKYPDAHEKMGTLLMLSGRIDEAISCFNDALQISKNQVEIYAKLGLAYSQSGKSDQAIENLTKAVELKSNSAIVYNNLAWLLATNETVTDANEAIEYARRACELTAYNEPGALDTLAVAYAAGGRFEDSVKTAEEAIETARSQGKEDLINDIQGRLELYKQGRPYREK